MISLATHLRVQSYALFLKRPNVLKLFFAGMPEMRIFAGQYIGIIMGLLFTKTTDDTADGKTLTLHFGGTPHQGEEQRYAHRTLPAEWHPQSAVQLTWPHAATDWADYLEEAERCYLRMAYEIALRQPLLIVSTDSVALQALLEEQLPAHVLANITLHQCPTNDTWARDHGFITVMGPEGVELHDYRFNGWGGKFDAQHDNAINASLFAQGRLKGEYIDHLDFELEGGGIESDGRGTLLVTSECLLNPNRNPQYTKADIEARLKAWLGMERILWLDHGYLAGDDTDSHIDTLARLCPNDTIVYVRCTDPEDEHYEALRAMEEQLRTFRTPTGQPYRLLPLPMARPAYYEGERLPATYANFLIINGAVLYPTYGTPTQDEAAAKVLATAFPHYDIVGIDCQVLIRQHGSLHCATMQFPRGVFNTDKASS